MTSGLVVPDKSLISWHGHARVEKFWEDDDVTPVYVDPDGHDLRSHPVWQRRATPYEVRHPAGPRRRLKVTLRVSLQYLPTFVDTAAVKLRRNGTRHKRSRPQPGQRLGQQRPRLGLVGVDPRLVADFLDKLFVQINWAVIDRVQLGGGPAGELQYPTRRHPVVGLLRARADRHRPRRRPDGVPVARLCALHRHHVDGDRHRLGELVHPEPHQLDALADRQAPGLLLRAHLGDAPRRRAAQGLADPDRSQALNYRVNVAKGVDWDHQIAAYPDADVHPYSTWADGAHFFPSGAFGDTTDGDAAAWYHLLRVARARGRAKRLWGENTGGQTNADMDRVFASGAVAYGYEGLAWLSHDSLADGTSDTYANLTARIATANAAVGDYVRGVNMAGGSSRPTPRTCRAPTAPTTPTTPPRRWSRSPPAATRSSGCRSAGSGSSPPAAPR
jgi:hypothetical protein